MEEHGTGLRLTYAEARRPRRPVGGRPSPTRIAPGDRVVLALPNGYGVLLAVPGRRARRRRRRAREPEDAAGRDRPRRRRLVGRARRRTPSTSSSRARPPAARGGARSTPTTSPRSSTRRAPPASPRAPSSRTAPSSGGRRSGPPFPSGLRRDEAVSGMPVAHIAGFAVLVQTASLGVPVYVHPAVPPRRRARCHRDSAGRRCSSGVPAMYRMMDEAGADGARPVVDAAVGVGRRRHAVPAGAPVPAVRGRRPAPARRSPRGEAAFVDGYGMVELGGGAAVKVLPPGCAAARAGARRHPAPRLPAEGRRRHRRRRGPR